MDFALLDGVAQWATHKKDGVLFFDGDEIPDDAVPVNHPDEQTLLVAEKLKGKFYSKSKFKEALYNYGTDVLTDTLKLRADIDYLAIMTGVDI